MRPAWVRFLDVSSTTRLAASLTWLRKLPKPLFPRAGAAMGPEAACASAKHAPMTSATPKGSRRHYMHLCVRVNHDGSETSAPLGCGEGC